MPYSDPNDARVCSREYWRRKHAKTNRRNWEAKSYKEQEMKRIRKGVCSNVDCGYKNESETAMCKREDCSLVVIEPVVKEDETNQ